MSFELRHTNKSLFPVRRDDPLHELFFTGEMMVNAGLADMHCIRNVGIAEAVISADCQESLGTRDDFASFCREPDFHGGTLPTSRAEYNPFQEDGSPSRRVGGPWAGLSWFIRGGFE